MIDWNIVITAVSSFLFSGSLVSAIAFWLYKKQNKKIKDSEVVTNDATAASEMLNFTKEYQQFSQELFKQFQEVVSKKDEIILENKKRLCELEDKINEHTKKIKHITQILAFEQTKRNYAEKNICLVKDCELRVPKRGQFKTEDFYEE